MTFERFTWWVEQFFTTEELKNLYQFGNDEPIPPQHLWDKYCRLESIYCKRHNARFLLK